jgi:hypothetical protein
MLESAPSSLIHFLGRRNAASASPLFDRILDCHCALHDLAKPLAKAEYEHALDTWQWVIELDPEAGLAVQVAALYHDIERVASEASARVERRTRDYQAFKDEHARTGALVAARSLAVAGLPASDIPQVANLVAGHERPRAVGEAALLADADVLSFFSHTIQGFLRSHGPFQTQLEIAWSLRRLRPEARRLIERIRFEREVALLVAAALGGSR